MSGLQKVLSTSVEEANALNKVTDINQYDEKGRLLQTPEGPVPFGTVDYTKSSTKKIKSNQPKPKDADTGTLEQNVQAAEQAIKNGLAKQGIDFNSLGGLTFSGETATSNNKVIRSFKTGDGRTLNVTMDK